MRTIGTGRGGEGNSVVSKDVRRAAIRAYIERIAVTQPVQLLPGQAAAHSALAMQQKHLALVFNPARQTRLNSVQGKIDRVWQMTGVELRGSPHINHQGAVLQAFACCLLRNLTGTLQQEEGRKESRNGYDNNPVHCFKITAIAPLLSGSGPPPVLALQDCSRLASPDSTVGWLHLPALGD